MESPKNQPPALPSSITFRPNHVWFKYVLKPRLDPHAMERLCAKWKTMSIGNRTVEGRGVNIGTDHIDLYVVVKTMCAISNRTATNNQYARPLFEKMQSPQEFLSVLLRYRVCAGYETTDSGPD